MGQPASDSEWTKEKVIEKLRRKREKLGKSPSKRDVDDSLVNAAEKHFGSWNNAKEKAGLETFEFRGSSCWSKEKVIDGLGKLAKDLGKSPASTDDQSLAQAALRYFDSWNDAKKATGLKVFPPPDGRDWSKEEVIREMKNLANKVGRTPKPADDRNLKLAACRWFESWNRALEAAGVDSMEPREDAVLPPLKTWENGKEILEEVLARHVSRRVHRRWRKSDPLITISSKHECSAYSLSHNTVFLTAQKQYFNAKHLAEVLTHEEEHPGMVRKAETGVVPSKNPRLALFS